MITPGHLVLFIDYQNAYRRARDVFFPGSQSGRDGHLRPMELGRLIAGRGGPDGTPYALSEVRSYSGRLDPKRAWRTFSAHRRQSQRWRLDGATVVERQLRYPQGRLQEKGVDVGVMMSTDNDLLPALEAVCDHGPSGCRVEVAAWRTPRGREQRLWFPSLWCHWLSVADYEAVADRNRY